MVDFKVFKELLALRASKALLVPKAFKVYREL
jgi:hypothetical protein